MSVDILVPPNIDAFGSNKMKFSQEDDAKMGASVEAESPLYKTDEFRMYCFKVLPCSKRYCHDWTTCPFAHPGEKAKRRDPRFSQYTGIACPEMKKNLACPRGETCPYAHNVFEYWLHPSRYRTQLCNDGVNCKRKVCFFAHTLEELRVPACKPVLPDGTVDTRVDADFGFAAGSSFQGFSSDECALPQTQTGPQGSPVSILGKGPEMWESGTSASNTPTSTWSPYNSSSVSYSNRSSSDNSSAPNANRAGSPSQLNPSLDQLAQTLASLNLSSQQVDQPLASILNLIMSQQANPLTSPTALTPSSAAAAAAALFNPQQTSIRPLRSFPIRQTNSLPFGASIPSPSSAILGNRPEPAIDPTFPYQSALYAPSTLAHMQASQQAQAQAVQAAQAAQAAYAAEVDSLRRRSLDSATQALYNRILSQQLEAASHARRSFDVRSRNQVNTQLPSLQPTWSTQSDFSFDQVPQQQQPQQQQAQAADQGGNEEAEQLLRSAFTSASQELSSDDELVANLDMYRMISDLQQQQQQQQQ